jgi:proteasome lid subunit RPN8/RPN11
MTTLAISPADLQSICARCAEAYPREGCGLLIGTHSGNTYRVSRIVWAENVTQEDPASRFEVDPALLFRIHRELRDSREELIGHFHSHPDGAAQPSETDRGRAWEADQVWLIVGTDSNGEARPAAYRATGDGAFDPVHINGAPE